MAGTTTLHDAFIDELCDAHNAEKQLLKELGKLAQASSNPRLREAFESHRDETEGHIARLEQVFERLGERVRDKHCDGIAGIIEEGRWIMKDDFNEATLDACLIAAGQLAEHYEIAAYSSLVAWANELGQADIAALLQATLEEEKAADVTLSELARNGINRSAAVGAGSDEPQAARLGRDGEGKGGTAVPGS
jgi:ferritin-like metal-binding protein YciE